MKFKFLSLFIIFLMIFSSLGAASATITDNNQKIKDNNSVIVVNNLTVNGIQDAVNTAQKGDTILINGSIKGKGTKESFVNCGKDLSVLGQNCVLNKLHWLQYQGVVNFRNINFSGNAYNTYSNSGAAINANNNVTVNNCSFINNTADIEGGAIYARGSVKAYNSYFKNNNVRDGDGGAIYTYDDITVENSSFNENTAYGDCIWQCEGGAIHSADTLRVFNSNFTNNYASDYGGAVWTDSYCIIDHCLFNNNRAYDNDGGAIYIDNKCNIDITNSAFYGNFACGYGGAIECDSIESYLCLSGNAFENNTCTKQGDVAFSYGYYENVNGNWWGTTNPDWNSVRGLLVEHNYFKSNIKHSDSNPLDYNPLI